MATFSSPSQSKPRWELNNDKLAGFLNSVYNNQQQLALEYASYIIQTLLDDVKKLQEDLAEVKAEPKAKAAAPRAKAETTE